jgi:hypothetical protein
MKKIVLFSLAVLFALALVPSCGKGGGGGGTTPCSETGLQVTTTPATGSVEPAGVGPDFPLTINITAGLPTAGVTIEVTAAPEAGGANFFTKTVTDVKVAQTSMTITGTPAATASLVKITVTSKSCATNKWTGSYRYSRK